MNKDILRFVNLIVKQIVETRCGPFMQYFRFSSLFIFLFLFYLAGCEKEQPEERFIPFH